MARVRPWIARTPRRRGLCLIPLEDRCVPAGGLWTQRGGDRGHTGFADVTVNAVGISPAWSQTIDFTSYGYWAQHGNRAVAIDESRVYRTELDQSSGTADFHVLSYDLETGTPVWDRVLDASGLSAPSVGNGYVYVNRAGHSSYAPEHHPYLAALDPETGTVDYVNYEAQAASDIRPLLDGNQVFDDDGYYGDTAPGTPRPSTGSGTGPTWPAGRMWRSTAGTFTRPASWSSTGPTARPPGQSPLRPPTRRSSTR